MANTTGTEPASGIRAELRVGDPGDCPVARISETAGAPASGVSWSTSTEGGAAVEDFVVDADAPVADAGVTEVYRGRSERRYRFERRDSTCVCALIEDLGFPIADVHASDGGLYLTVYTTGLDQIRSIVDELRSRFGRVNVRQLVRSTDRADGSEGEELVLVDRSVLTDRQLEVLRTAFELGYFEYPKGANAGEVAAAVGVSPSTFSEHLAAAQSKILDAVLQF